MAFWSKKKIEDALIKYLNENNVTISKENNVLSFEIYFKDSKYSIFPYIIINEEEEEMSVIVNLKKVEEINAKYLSKINSFNYNSKYFTCKSNNENVIYLEYNGNINYDLLSKQMNKIIGSLFALQEQIDNI